jgi:threonine synthase
MKYYSLNHNALKFPFRGANTRIAPDKGLYFQKPLSSDFFDTIENLSNEEIALKLSNNL